MNEENITPNRNTKPATPDKPTGPDMPGGCGPEMAEMMRQCQCGQFLKKHWLAALTVFMLIVLAFFISQIGGILGIIAFFRTL